MGNNASSPKASGSAGQGSARNPVLVQNQRVAAAPPEQSMAHAQGLTAARPTSMPPRSYGSAAEAAVLAASSASPARSSVGTAAKPTDIKPRPIEVRGTAPSSTTRPVDVPHSNVLPPTAGAAAAAAAVAVPASMARVGMNTFDSDPPLSPYTDSMDMSMLHHNSMQDMSYLTRPPRLPLPIEEEVHTPGSPIIAPRKADSLLEEIEALDNDGLTHRSSTVSSTTVDEEDMEELRVDKTRPTVPTRLEWLRGGEKIYVTGTIFQWNKKQRLHPVEGRPGTFATTINVLPGTYHIRFLVDGQAETSRDMPTTVDFGNNLVNYIEVAPQSTPPKESDAAAAAAEMRKPKPNQQQSQGQPQPQQSSQLPSSQQHQQRKASQLSQLSSQQPSQQTKQQQQQQMQQSQQSQPQPLSTGELKAATPSSAELTTKLPRWKNVPPPSAFSHELPQYLVDYDQPDDSPAFVSASAATEILPPPPSLPGFLGKPILNASTLIKDDNSVLNMPNHSVLNHLATSSIKNNILAVSATTRYKDKFVTNIIYKPTGLDDKH
ncbi:snf1 kinase complex beta-subunit [Grosmannia clavigera kw1407]|uniref:Snf1 kinase complex beta-subunit n=1 Tax=Grosmannia clavigera (strain kw1407 / UAMH 11150) TaxID=655863 RepID=F0XLU4_GROCL|nr:snf1 kinase complex beta-subunit [Grosmannia clavigera kw1407]EFX01323.1 snf1 kinase complex beta-subunit [Grosmannia clavigera kw1407]